MDNSKMPSEYNNPHGLSSNQRVRIYYQPHISAQPYHQRHS
jgi:hypothetical protein